MDGDEIGNMSLTEQGLDPLLDKIRAWSNHRLDLEVL
jgi:hypothetical protein